ncbi:MAG: hypothetical protein F6K22_02450 [Okeania sp. SIO2F4]|uniref:hypothetical protein n=1 Tax=Okeania sp. SIO2F4 TaxID=2607790 RepID=UPI001428E82B|nr:hypothetical protein [Okeania sp. SIO2F4]NES01784.1 hypothetical protein [Okeania sp. SIO2F4]
MASENNVEKYIYVSPILDSKPSLGPIPSEQILPWGFISVVSLVLTQGVLGLGLMPTGLVTIWGCGSWWALTGSETWKFLGKFYPTPKWVSGNFNYKSILEDD